MSDAEAISNAVIMVAFLALMGWFYYLERRK